MNKNIDINEAMKNLQNLELLDEMAYKVGITDDSYLIYVNSDDSGYVPHFHYVDETSRGKDKKKGFHTCIRIDVPEYFKHGNKQDILNSNQLKELIEFLKQPFKRPQFNGTNWEFIRMSWNDNNSKQNVDEELKMPDYSKLNINRSYLNY